MIRRCLRLSPHSLGRAVAISGVASTAAFSGKSRPRCAPVRRPPTFGSSIRNYNTSGNNSTTDLLSLADRKKDNCPICEKYSQGPCGKFFTTWLECTDRHPGKDPTTQQDLHLSQCASFAAALADCLNQNEEYYEKPFQQDVCDDNRPEEDALQLQGAWEELIDKELTKVPRQAYPKGHQPQLEFRPNDRLGVIFVDLQDIQDQALLLVFVQDDDSKRLLSAGSLDDLFVFPKDGKETGVLQCTIPESTNQIVVSALYEGREDTTRQMIYTFVAKVPK